MQYDKTIPYKTGLVWTKSFAGGTSEVWYQTHSTAHMQKAKSIPLAKAAITRFNKKKGMVL